jgi:DNA polymerase III epsilon subunit-like protein
LKKIRIIKIDAPASLVTLADGSERKFHLLGTCGPNVVMKRGQPRCSHARPGNQLWEATIRVRSQQIDVILCKDCESDWWVGNMDRQRKEPIPQKFLVLDTETTDLKPALGHVVDFAAVRVDLKDRTVTPVFESLCNPGLSLEQLRATWICTKGGLNPGAVLAADPVAMVARQFKDLLRMDGDLPWTSWNMPFDEGFLTKEPWDLDFAALPDLMRAATPVCEIEGPYGDFKWPSLEEAYRIILHRKSPGAHRALIDATRAGELALALRRTGAWP